jgi:hypothetical protein
VRSSAAIGERKPAERGARATSPAAPPGSETRWPVGAPPLRMFTVVRAIAPVAANPPKNGAMTLPVPSASSSASGSCRVPVMPSETTAQRRDSMAPSSAMANALGTSIRMVAKSRWSSGPPASVTLQGQANVGGMAGMPPKREAMVSTRKPGTQCARPAVTSATEPSATSAAGTRPPVRRGQRTSSPASPGRCTARRGGAWAAPRRALPGARGSARVPVGRSPRKSELQRGDDHRDAGGEAGRHRGG